MNLALRTVLVATWITVVSPLAAGESEELLRYDMLALQRDGATVVSPATWRAQGVEAEAIRGTAEGPQANEFGVSARGLLPEGVFGFSGRSPGEGDYAAPFWEFTLSPRGGMAIAFTALVVDVGAATVLSANDTKWDYALTWSVDEHQARVGLIEGPSVRSKESSAIHSEESKDITIDLSHLPAQENPVTFRITRLSSESFSGVASQRAGWLGRVVVRGEVRRGS